MSGDELLDTDVFADHLRGFRAIGPNWRPTAYSAISRAELFAGSATQEDRIAELLGVLRELPVEREIAEMAGRTRRDVGVPLPDALIAATAITHDLWLRTRNTRHFSSISGLLLA